MGTDQIIKTIIDVKCTEVYSTLHVKRNLIKYWYINEESCLCKSSRGIYVTMHVNRNLVK
jgi:hypothetical protein